MLDIITAAVIYGGAILAVAAAIGLGISAVMLLSYALSYVIKIAFKPL